MEMSEAELRSEAVEHCCFCGKAAPYGSLQLIDPPFPPVHAGLVACPHCVLTRLSQAGTGRLAAPPHL